MYITIGIPTWNRARLLDQALAEMRGLRIPGHVDWELLVVNNNCTDDTDDIIAKHQTHLPIRGLFEPQPGRSFALNRAIREARGEYILWTDDDALVDSEWVAAYSEAFTLWPNASFFGGAVMPWFEGSLPIWLRDVLPRVANAYAIRNFGNKPLRLDKETLPYGVNMAVRTKEQAQYLYDTNLGIRPSSAAGGEEIALMRKMLAEGAEGRWVPGAIVRHYIPENRQTTGYLRFYYRGVGEKRALQVRSGGGPKVLGKPVERWLGAIEAEIKYRIRRLVSKPEVWIQNLIRSSQAWGLLRGCGKNK